MKNQIIAITQARTGSSRLPNKILKEIDGTSLLEIHINRIKQSKYIDKLIVATTDRNEDAAIISLADKWGLPSYAGSEQDVLDRFYQAVKEYRPKYVVRLTSDCPLIDPVIIDGVIAMAIANNLDYCTNCMIEHFPDGQDVEVFKFEALEYSWHKATLSSDREHVTPFIRNNSSYKGKDLFTSMNYPCLSDYGSIRMTVDEQQDFDLIHQLVTSMGTDNTWLEYVDFIVENNLQKINSDIIRNEGYYKSLKNDIIK